MANPDNMTPADPGPRRDKPLCGGRRRDGSGDTCRRPAGWGTDHVGIGACKLHGGATPNAGKAAQREQARRDVERFGGSLEVDPATALLQEVHRSAATVEYLRQRVNELDQDEIVWGVVEETDRPIVYGKDGDPVGGGLEVKRKATPNAWVVLYQQERRHLAQVSKAAIDAGCAQSLVEVFQQVASTYVQLVGRVLDRVMGELALPDEERGRAGELVRVAFESELNGLTGGGEAA
jgi:hypothetical protein